MSRSKMDCAVSAWPATSPHSGIQKVQTREEEGGKGVDNYIV